MARITTVIACSHSPFLFQSLEWWNATRDVRARAHHDTPGLPPAPADSDEANALKRGRTDAAFARLREIFEAARPDVVVVFGDDQAEQFELTNHPAFAVYAGGAFEGYRTVAYDTPLGSRERRLKPRTPAHWVSVPTREDLARDLLVSLMRDGVDAAMMLGMPRPDEGMGHAFMRPVSRITGDRFDVPVLPVLVNCFYAPQPTGARCVTVGRTVRRAIEAWPDDLNVAVLGSGGLWHTPGAPDAYIDEDFDREMLRLMASGDVDALAAAFDQWRPAEAHAGRRCYASFDGGTGMPGHLGSGTGETRNWILAAAVADGPAEILDYVPVHASPCGMGFAHWPQAAIGALKK